MKLTIELVPHTSWYNNLRKKIPRRHWDRLRKRIYREHDYKCGICGVEGGRLNCHEVWSYNDEEHVQKLEGFIALCDSCHFIKHIGLAGILASRNQLDYDELIEHFIKVNNCSRDDFDKQLDEASKTWADRSQYNWKIDFGDYTELIEKYAKA